MCTNVVAQAVPGPRGGSVSGLAGEDALTQTSARGSTEMIDLEVPDEDNVENKTTGEPEDTSSARLVRKEDAGLMGSESAESIPFMPTKLWNGQWAFSRAKAFARLWEQDGVGLVSQTTPIMGISYGSVRAGARNGLPVGCVS